MNTDSLLYAADVFLNPDGDLAVVLCVPAWRERHQQWVLWCPYCGGVHHHGRVPDEIDVHRLSHCSAVARGNYLLRPVPGPRPTRRPTVLSEAAKLARANKRARSRLAWRRR